MRFFSGSRSLPTTFSRPCSLMSDWLEDDLALLRLVSTVREVKSTLADLKSRFGCPRPADITIAVGFSKRVKYFLNLGNCNMSEKKYARHYGMLTKVRRMLNETQVLIYQFLLFSDMYKAYYELSRMQAERAMWQIQHSMGERVHKSIARLSAFAKIYLVRLLAERVGLAKPGVLEAVHEDGRSTFRLPMLSGVDADAAASAVTKFVALVGREVEFQLRDGSLFLSSRSFELDLVKCPEPREKRWTLSAAK